MLQSKQNDQFDTLGLTHVAKEVENEEKTVDGLQKKLKWM